MNEKNLMSYWCSWTAQNRLAYGTSELSGQEKIDAFVGDWGAQQSRSMLCESNVFGEGGFARQLENIRGDLYFMMDDGWDVNYGIHPDTNKQCFGSLIVSEERFPCVKGQSPAQRLKTLNDKLKALGWKGLGIWVCAHRASEDYTRPFEKEDIRYWEERVSWCKEAGVQYWKVDWGTHEHDVDFRRALTDSAKRLYPQLIIEHAIPIPPLNGMGAKEETYSRFEGTRNYAQTLETVRFSTVFRSYDVTESNHLSTATTFARLAILLKEAGGYINGEDELYMNAVLGCHSGIMRSGYYPFEDKNHASNKLCEADCFVHWQRISPPFIGGSIETSQEMLADNMVFYKGDTWYAYAFDKNVVQYAPAVIARNVSADSVRVEGDIKPFVALSLSPDNVYAVGVFPRTIDGKYFYPSAALECYVPKTVHTVGVFGEMDSITLKLESVPQKASIASLIGGESVDISDRIDANAIKITKEDVAKVFKTSDSSAPAIVVKFE